MQDLVSAASPIRPILMDTSLDFVHHLLFSTGHRCCYCLSRSVTCVLDSFILKWVQIHMYLTDLSSTSSTGRCGTAGDAQCRMKYL